MDNNILILRFKDCLYIIRETFKGKTLSRAIFNIFVRDYELTGQVIDLGAKSKTISYYNSFKLIQPCQVTYTDLFSKNEGVVELDLEKPFQINNGIYDYALCIFTLEHVYNYLNVFIESNRILKTGGRLIGAVPLLHNYHADPKDYFRFTHDSLAKIAEVSGYQVERIVVLGMGPYTAGFQLKSFLLPKFLRAFFVCVNLLRDFLFLKIRPNRYYPLSYGFIFIKK